MKLKHFRRAIHWDQIILYFVAFWLCSHAFQVLAALFDIQAAEAVRFQGDASSGIDIHQIDAGRLVSLNVALNLGNTIGVFVGFGYSIYLAKLRGGNWINPTIAFVLVMVLGFLHLLGWSLVKNIFLSPGSIFNGAMYYVVDGVILLLLGGGIIYFNHKMKKRKSEDRSEDVDFA